MFCLLVVLFNLLIVTSFVCWLFYLVKKDNLLCTSRINCWTTSVLHPNTALFRWKIYSDSYYTQWVTNKSPAFKILLEHRNSINCSLTGKSKGSHHATEWLLSYCIICVLLLLIYMNAIKIQHKCINFSLRCSHFPGLLYFRGDVLLSLMWTSCSGLLHCVLL